ncbi:glycerophosphodiester phosphodiesterase family protein [Dyadobacter fermentans]|uniref:glycerophosphodiester phosphodiesterase family protein n=1 Tax=Dyadobacter fermentans TaxID=94254 RepID=UPI001CBE34AC|nr:glycerophosphodiester phosphodiesterase family protein [Dyadobacter fermentans]MBZ1358209.1 glycerophosphodiester phosphodiesterase family protein [Dyadobacter fermentans]
MKKLTRQALALLLLAALSHTAQAQTGDCQFKDAEALKTYLKPGKRTTPLIMAHQGGTEDGYPGNSMATFERTYSKVPCVLLEIDVRATADSLLVVSHDDELALKTNGKGLLSKKKWKEVSKLRLKDPYGSMTEYPIPTFQEVLNWSAGKNFVLIVDKKPETSITQTIRMLQGTGNLYKSVLICYSLKEAQLAHQLAPQLMLAVGFNSPEHIDAVEQSGLPLEQIVALTPRELQESSFYQRIHDLNVTSSLGTNGNVDTLQVAESRPLYQKLRDSSGPDIICTDNPILVQSIFYKKD